MRGTSGPDFAHPSERAYADLLDAAGIRWVYEPHQFALRRDATGRVREAFVPDFYLPDLDVYVECTTARQRLTNRKNRKARATARIYGVIVNLLYRRDLERLAELYGGA
jgi:bifunctional protein TilS/HprT